MAKKTIKRSQLVAAAEVLTLFSTAGHDDTTVGEMREKAFEKIPRDELIEVMKYFEALDEYDVIEDVEE